MGRWSFSEVTLLHSCTWVVLLFSSSYALSFAFCYSLLLLYGLVRTQKNSIGRLQNLEEITSGVKPNRKVINWSEWILYTMKELNFWVVWYLEICIESHNMDLQLKMFQQANQISSHVWPCCLPPPLPWHQHLTREGGAPSDPYHTGIELCQPPMFKNLNLFQYLNISKQ